MASYGLDLNALNSRVVTDGRSSAETRLGHYSQVSNLLKQAK